MPPSHWWTLNYLLKPVRWLFHHCTLLVILLSKIPSYFFTACSGIVLPMHFKCIQYGHSFSISMSIICSHIPLHSPSHASESRWSFHWGCDGPDSGGSFVSVYNASGASSLGFALLAWGFVAVRAIEHWLMECCFLVLVLVWQTPAPLLWLEFGTCTWIIAFLPSALLHCCYW